MKKDYNLITTSETGKYVAFLQSFFLTAMHAGCLHTGTVNLVSQALLCKN